MNANKMNYTTTTQKRKGLINIAMLDENINVPIQAVYLNVVSLEGLEEVMKYSITETNGVFILKRQFLIFFKIRLGIFNDRQTAYEKLIQLVELEKFILPFFYMALNSIKK